MTLRPELEVRQALQDSQALLDNIKPDIPEDRKHVPFKVLEEVLVALAVINEISTLKWYLNEDQLSCYNWVYSSAIRTAEEVERALKDSIAYFKETYPDKNLKHLVINVKTDIPVFKIAGEICTLKWMLGNGVLNCYGTD